MEAGVVIRGGLVVEGPGSCRIGDVAIEGDRIVAVGQLGEIDAATVIDATDCVVLPGFIDAHVHAEGHLLGGDPLEGALLQGVTTFILGQDGTSTAPTADAETRSELDAYWSALNGPTPASIPARLSVGDLLREFDGGPLNVAYLVPNGNLRLAAIGWHDERADAAAIATMRKLLEAGLEDGAVGFSSGLDYTPSKHADTAELKALCAALSGLDVPYVTHMRGYGPRVDFGVDESVEIVREAGIPLHISHFWGKTHEVIPQLDRLEADGLSVTFDTYPFVAGSTILAMAALPPDLQTGSPAAVTDRLRTEAGRERVREHVAAAGTVDVGAMILAFVDSPSLRELEGMTLAAAARERGLSVGDLVVELLTESGFRAAVIVQKPDALGDADIRAAALDRRQMVGSDGIYSGSHPHVRGYSTFAKFIDIAVGRGDGLDWAEAAEHLSTRAARRFKLEGRGSIAPGAFADVVVLRPGDLSYSDDVREAPRLARGVEHVFVNGVAAVADGKATGGRGGQALRRSDHA